MSSPTQAPGSRPPFDPRRGRWVLAATIIASSMAFVDGTVVNVALPALQTALHATVSDVQWVVESYALLLAALLLVGGSLGDLYGRRKIFLIGVVLFAIGSAFCGFSPTIQVLIGARALQGVGAALLVPGSLSIITAYFPEDVRGHAIGTWSGSTAATAAVGPVIGGWLVEHASWRYAFFLNLPLAIAVVVISALCVPESCSDSAHPNLNPDDPAAPPHRKLDYPGAISATLALGGITYALIAAPTSGRRALVVGVFGLLALVAFFLAEHRANAPMVPFSFFRSRDFTGANLITLFLYTALSGMLFFYPLDLIQIQHYTATQAGAALLPLIILMFLLSRWAGGLVTKHGARLPLTIGPLITGLGFVSAIFTKDIGGSYWTTFFPTISLIGLGMSIAVAPLTTTVMNALPQSIAGIASGINNAVSRVAGLLSVAVLGLLLVSIFNRTLTHRLDALHLAPAARHQVDLQRPNLAAAHVPDPAAQQAIAQSFVEGYHWVLWATAFLALLAALSAWFLLDPHHGKRCDPTPQPQP